MDNDLIVYIEGVFKRVYEYYNLRSHHIDQGELQDILSGDVEDLLERTVRLLNSIFHEIGIEPPKTFSQVLESSASKPLSHHPRICKTLWLLTESLALKDRAQVYTDPQGDTETLQSAPSTSAQPSSSTAVGTHSDLKEQLIKSRSEVSALYTLVDTLTRERDEHSGRVSHLEGRLKTLEVELEHLRHENLQLTLSLKNAHAEAKLHMSFEERCDDLKGAARIISESLAVTPHLPPLHELTSLSALTPDPHALRREVLYQQRPARLRYVDLSRDLPTKLAEDLWSLEAKNAHELSGVGDPAIARLIFSAPPAAPGFSVWIEPNGVLLSSVIGSANMGLCEIKEISRGLISALETLAGHRVLTTLPSLDALIYDKSSKRVSLAEPCAISESVLNPPELTIAATPHLYRWSRVELEQSWVFGACELFRLLLLPESHINNSRSGTEGERLLRIAVQKAYKRDAPHAYEETIETIETLRSTVLRGFSDNPKARPRLAELKRVLS